MRLARLALGVTGTCLGLAALAAARAGSTDDLFVVLVQARNLLAGEGLVWRPGGAPLNASTSTLDVAWKACWLALLPGSGLAAAWWATTTAYIASVVALTLHCLPKRRADALRGAAFALALAVAPGLAEGTAYGLEAPLVALAVVALLRVCVLPARSSLAGEAALGAGLFALGLARPEVLLLALFGAALRAARARGRTVAALVVVAAASLMAAGVHAAVFGDWAPNSYRAKLSSNRWNELRDGLEYAAAGLRDPAGLGVGLSLVTAWAFARDVVARTHTRLATAAFVLLILAGGDGYAGLRLWVPASILALAAAASAATAQWAGAETESRLALGSARRRSSFGLLLVGPLLVIGGTLTRLLPAVPSPAALLRLRAWSEEDFAAQRGMAEALLAIQPPARVAHLHHQSLGWFAPALETLDLSGLTEPRIARRPAPGRVRFGREALDVALDEGCDVLLLAVEPAQEFPLTTRPLEAWLHDPLLRNAAFGVLRTEPYAAQLVAAYTVASRRSGASEAAGTWLNVLVRCERAEDLRRAGFEVHGP